MVNPLLLPIVLAAVAAAVTPNCQIVDHVVLGQPSHFPCHLSNSFQNALDVDIEMLDEVAVASTNCLDAKET